MKKKKVPIWWIFLLLLASLLLLVGFNTKRGSIKKKPQDPSVIEKGYDLPLAKKKSQQVQRDCRRKMAEWKELYQKTEKGSAINAVLSRKTRLAMASKLATKEQIVYIDDRRYQMFHPEKMEQFLKNCAKGQHGSIVIYEIHLDGSLTRHEFSYDGTHMYLLDCIGVWLDEKKTGISQISYNRLKDFKYTKKGWFLYELCTPEFPEVSEEINASFMMRVKPIPEEYQKAAEKYLDPIGYRGNNLFRSDWKEGTMDHLDFDGLYDYLYVLEYGKEVDSDQYPHGIAKEEFESLMKKYLPVSSFELQKNALYHEQTKSYEYQRLGYQNHDILETAIGEITDIKKQKDGTITLFVDVVCEMKGTDRVYSHQLTIQPFGHKRFRYISNQIIGNARAQIPAYE
jgi:hypothetical protein